MLWSAQVLLEPDRAAAQSGAAGRIWAQLPQRPEAQNTGRPSRSIRKLSAGEIVTPCLKKHFTGSSKRRHETAFKWGPNGCESDGEEDGRGAGDDEHEQERARTTMLMASAALLCPWIVVAADPPVSAGPRPAAELAPYPPMHWHSWNTFCAEDMVNHTNMREMADALISSVRQ